jgi:cytochrome P450
MTTRFNTNPLRPSNFFYSYPSALNRRHRQAKSLLRTFLADEVSKRRSAFTKTKDLLGFMVDAHEASKDAAAGPSVNMDEVLTDIMMTILFAGYDTTSITLCYALYLVSQHENVYEQCLREINASSSLTKVEDLEYCRAVVQEALRLYPPAPSTLRLTTRPITLHDGFVVPTGTIVFIPIWSMHRLEHNFARAIEFLPERWVAKGKDGKWAERVPSDTSAANMQAFFAFSGGARNCPGGRFAVQEATILLAGLLKHLRFEALPDYKLTPGKIAVVQHPSDCLPMRISRRKVT